MKNIMKKYALALGLTGAALVGIAQAQDITLGYVLWDSEIASTHVVGAVLEDELGYDVELISVDAGPMWTGLAQGDFDAIVAAWLPYTHEAYWDQYGDSLTDLGPNLEGADLGLAVPAYVTVDSLTELNEHADEFDNRIIGIDPGAGLMAATERAIEVYGLTDIDLIDGSDAAMAAGLDRAINRDEWVVVTSWRPHWMWASYDLKYLEDPEGAFGEAETINTILSNEFAENGPEDAIAFLDSFHWTGEEMGAVMNMIINEGMDPGDAARQWLADNPDRVAEWLE